MEEEEEEEERNKIVEDGGNKLVKEEGKYNFQSKSVCSWLVGAIINMHNLWNSEPKIVNCFYRSHLHFYNENGSPGGRSQQQKG